MSSRSGGMGDFFAVMVPLTIAGIVISQRVWDWAPAGPEAAKLHWSIAILILLWLFYALTNTRFIAGSSSREQIGILCGNCGKATTLGHWHKRGSCSYCGHHVFEYESKAHRYAKHLQTVAPIQREERNRKHLRSGAPPPEPVGRRVSVSDLARPAASRRGKSAVRERLTTTVAQRDPDQRF